MLLPFKWHNKICEKEKFQGAISSIHFFWLCFHKVIDHLAIGNILNVCLLMIDNVWTSPFFMINMLYTSLFWWHTTSLKHFDRPKFPIHLNCLSQIIQNLIKSRFPHENQTLAIKALPMQKGKSTRPHIKKKPMNIPTLKHPTAQKENKSKHVSITLSI
jgi:hypothetical protein